MPKNFTRRMSFERRAIVAIACYFLVMQAFLAALAGGFAAGGFAVGGFAAGGIGGGSSELASAFICHGAGGASDLPADDGKPKFLCGLCVLATSGDTPPAAPAVFVPAPRAVTRVAVSADFTLSLSSFDPRAGRSRAPPVLALS
jgi:hypothetical protein